MRKEISMNKLKNEIGVLRSVGKLCLYGSIVIGVILLVLCLMAMSAMSDLGGYFNAGSSLTKIPLLFLLLAILFTITGIGVGTLLNGLAEFMEAQIEESDYEDTNAEEKDYEKYRREMLEKFNVKQSDTKSKKQSAPKNSPLDI